MAAHRSAAAATRLAFACIDEILLLEVAGGPVGTDEITQTAATGGNGFGERGADFRAEPMAAFRPQTSGFGQRMDARPEQAFRGVDVADTDNHMAVHDEALDRAARATGGVVQPLAVEGVAQRLDAEAGEQRALSAGRNPGDEAEPPRVAVAQQPVTEGDVHMVVGAGRGVRAYDAQAA